MIRLPILEFKELALFTGCHVEQYFGCTMEIMFIGGNHLRRWY